MSYLDIILLNREKELIEKQEEKIKEMRKRTHPDTNADFSRLYNELDQWRRNEVIKIKVFSPLFLFLFFLTDLTSHPSCSKIGKNKTRT